MNNKVYIYPRNLKSSAYLWLWSIKDFLIIAVAILISAIILVTTKMVVPLGLSIGYGFLSISFDDTTIFNYIKYSVKYFMLSQQQYFWRFN